MQKRQAPAIKFADVTLGYDGHPAVHHLRGEMASGSMTAVVGPNGSGKSTLIKGIVGLLHPIDGHIDIEGLDRSQISYLPQQANIDRSFPISVIEMVSLGLWPQRGMFASITAADRDRVADAIATVGLTGFEARTLDTLSGGQLQRVLFARVLVQDSSLILLDEPFTAIDTSTANHLMDLIERWHDEDRTVVAVLHDLDLARERFPQTLLMAREPIAWGPSKEVLTPANLLRLRSMSESWDDTAPWCERAAG